MSAGNYVLYSAGLFPTTFPSVTTVLPSGNYWIEEIDFTLTYATASTAAFANGLFFLETSGSLTVWLNAFAISFSAAGTNIYNTPINNRPRIFLPRGNSLTFTVTNMVAGITLVGLSLNLYGRSLP